MAHEGLREAARDLPKESRYLHRVIVSLIEELEAMDWHQ